MSAARLRDEMNECDVLAAAYLESTPRKRQRCLMPFNTVISEPADYCAAQLRGTVREKERAFPAEGPEAFAKGERFFNYLDQC
jgi:hypothetical protein